MLQPYPEDCRLQLNNDWCSWGFTKRDNKQKRHERQQERSYRREAFQLFKASSQHSCGSAAFRKLEESVHRPSSHQNQNLIDAQTKCEPPMFRRLPRQSLFQRALCLNNKGLAGLPFPSTTNQQRQAEFSGCRNRCRPSIHPHRCTGTHIAAC